MKEAKDIKATGIVRRIDELGRIVIPKELRRTLRFREGEELEVFTDTQDSLILRKFSPVKIIRDYAGETAQALHETSGNIVLICDKDRVIAAAGDKKGIYLNKMISSKFERTVDMKEPLLHFGADTVSVSGESTEDYKGQVIVPIISQGYVLGAVVMVSLTSRLGDTETKLCTAGALFLSYQA